MKYILAILIIVIGIQYIDTPKDLVIEYYYDGPYPDSIQQGLNYWASDYLNFQRVSDISDAYLIIAHADPQFISNSKWVAQYMSRQKTILINKKYKDILIGDNLAGVVAHEAGHFLGLDHNTERRSIMNDKAQYNSLPSFRDKQRVKSNLLTLNIKKYIDDKFFPNSY